MQPSLTGTESAEGKFVDRNPSILFQAEEDFFLWAEGGGDGGVEGVDQGRKQLEVFDDGGGEAGL